ncbi:MAG: type II toxin-antitoxin system RelE/ParE family toxin [Chryseolinea sp.]
MKVTISERAERNLDNIVLYLETKWSVRIRDRFLGVLSMKIEQIVKTPHMYEASSKKKAVRRCVVTKHTALYYKAKKEEIEIVTIQDTRQNPNKLKL